MDSIATARIVVLNRKLRGKRAKLVRVTKCGQVVPISDKRILLTSRWDATSCKTCLRIGDFQMPRVDWSQVEDFKPLPSGIYQCRLSGWKFEAAAKSSGQPFYALEFTVDEGEYQNRKLFRNQSLQPNSLWALKQTLMRLGAKETDFADDKDLDEVVASVVGNECRLDVDQREYEGTMRNNVKSVLAPAYAA